MYGFLFLIFILFVSQTASSDKTEEIEEIDKAIGEIIVDEATSYSMEAKEKEAPVMIMEYNPEDRLCDGLDEIIEILKEEGVESK